MAPCLWEVADLQLRGHAGSRAAALPNPTRSTPRPRRTTNPNDGVPHLQGGAGGPEKISGPPDPTTLTVDGVTLRGAQRSPTNEAACAQLLRRSSAQSYHEASAQHGAQSGSASRTCCSARPSKVPRPSEGSGPGGAMLSS